MNDIVFGYLHCGRKIRHKTRGKGRKSADYYNKKHPDNKVHEYFCEICEGWHVGHPKKSTKG